MAKKRPNPPKPAAPTPGGPVMLSGRVPPDLYQRVLVAAAQRRAQRAPPYTVQAIINEALRGWLTANGYSGGDTTRGRS